MIKFLKNLLKKDENRLLNQVEPNQYGQYSYVIRGEAEFNMISNSSLELPYSFSPLGNVFTSKFDWKEILKTTGVKPLL
jgi:predicted nucleotidyltransferase